MQVGNEISGTFNYPITLLSGTVKLFKDEVLYLTFTEADITVTDNAFSIDVTGMLTEVGEYRVELSAGLFSSVVGNSPYVGWGFTLAVGEYDETEYSTDFLIV